MRAIFFPYKMGSKSATALARSLGTKKVYADRAYRPKRNHLIINWGNSNPPRWAGGIMLNVPSAVALAANKKMTFAALSGAGVKIPEFTTNIEEAKQWLQGNYKVVIRSTVTGHGGAGITLAESEDQLISAPLYTKYFNGKREFRVHVFRNEVLDFTEKKRSSEATEVNAYVRNHSNGWVFCRENIILPDAVAAESVKAIAALGLDFGAVDIRYRERDGEVVVLEVNTAPGVEGTTITKYVEAIRRML